MFFSTMLHTDRASITVEFAAGSADPYQEEWKINKKTGPTCSEDLRSRTLATDAFFLVGDQQGRSEKNFQIKEEPIISRRCRVELEPISRITRRNFHFIPIILVPQCWA